MPPARRQNAKNSQRQLRNRLLLVSAFILLFSGGLIARLFFLQILQHDKFVAQSKQQYDSKLKVQFGRGNIMDRNGNVLATNVETESVYIHPAEILEKQTTARRLADALGLDYRQTLRAVNSRQGFVWIKRKCKPSEITALKRAHLPGVRFEMEHKRFYPKRELASHTLGFVGMDNQGLAGIEHFQHTVLKGKTSLLVLPKDNQGRQIRSLEDLEEQNKPNVRDVMLTLDEVIQFITEHELKKAVDLHRARRGMAIVMAPRTGEIYSIAVYPYYNPNNFSVYPSALWINHGIASAFEPGSIFKPILAAAAIDSGKAAPPEKFFCENGAFRIGKTIIREAANHRFGWLTLEDILVQSSNIGSVKVGKQLGAHTFFDYIKRFGFGDKLGVDLPGESRGLLRVPAQWSRRTLASLSFGQEIAVTPLQMIAAISAIANGGELLRPHLTLATFKGGKKIKTIRPRVLRRVISPETSRQMVEMLKKVVTRGTGKPAGLPGYDVAGKTGTAQKLDPQTGTYSQDKFLASFVGFVPANDPRIAVLVMIDEPEEEHYGGKVAAPVFREIASKTLRYLSIPSKKERVFIMDRA